MLTPTVIWFSFMFIYLVNTGTLAQPFISYACHNDNYTVNSTYQSNLDRTLSTLPATNSGLGFFNFSTGQGNDRVNSIALCRGDVNPSECRSCLNDSIAELRRVCPNQKEGIGYYDNCIVKYSNQTILQQTGFRYYVYIADTQNSSDVERFNEALRPLLADLRNKAAAGGPLRKFASDNTSGPGFETIYALVQCTPDLSEMQCNSCLEDSINRIPDFLNGRIGGRILKPMCNFRYEAYQFVNQSALVIPSPPPPPVLPSSPPPQQPSSPPGILIH